MEEYSMLFSPHPVFGQPSTLRCRCSWENPRKLNMSSGSDDDDEQVKKSPPSEQGGSGFIISGDAAGRVAHLEHSVRFLQEQHRLMLSGLHAEIEALRERNRDLQFQLIFNKESTPTPRSISTPIEESIDTDEEAHLKREIARLEKEAAAARGEARAAEARALQLQRIVDEQAEKLRDLEISSKSEDSEETGEESAAELRLRLADAERLVRRLRADAERQRRENRNKSLYQLADTPSPTQRRITSHHSLQCMKNSLHASLRASGMDAGYGFQNNYFPSVHAPEFWREPLREEYSVNGAAGGNRGCRNRRPVTLPELAGQQIHRSTVYANHYTRPRANGYENKAKKPQSVNGETPTKSPTKSTDESSPDNCRLKALKKLTAFTPEMNITQIVPTAHVTASQSVDTNSRQRPRRHHRKHADHT